MTDVDPQNKRLQRSKRRRLRGRWIALIVVASVVVFLVVAAFVTAHFTSRSSFCDDCHEMDPYYASWQTSTHSQAECNQCHIPPGLASYIETKFLSLRELWVHVTKQVKAPLAVTREIPNGSCLRCHQTPATLTLTNATFSHTAHAAQYCVTCHVRLVHRAVNPPYYVDPAAMSSCLACHNGTTAPGQCSTCHTPGHEPRGECSDCHGMEGWGPGAVFRHPFPRTGGHAGLACADCHVRRPEAPIIPGTDLPRPDPACISCHGDHHNGLTDCADCHTVAGWAPSTFVHPTVGEHIPSGKVPVDCASCHPSGYTSYSCIKCHDSNAGGD